MQAALCFSPAYLPGLRSKRSPTSVSNPSLQNTRHLLIRATVLPDDSSSVDYNSVNSVFPAEACETIGGEACAVEMFPEVKIKSEATTVKVDASQEAVDREYLEYTNPKTVFPAEACDDLGGEFCEPEYQKGVY